MDYTFKNNLIRYFVKEDKDLLKVVKLMISKNYTFSKYDIFDLAVNGFFETMEYFKSLGFDLDVRNDQNENALFYVIQSDVSKYNGIDGWWRTDDYIETIIENCVRLGIDEKVINKQGQNLLHAYSLSGMSDNYFDALIKYDIDINKTDNNGWTPLHCICAYHSDDNQYKKFLASGADKTIYTKKRNTHFEDEFDTEPTPEIGSAFDIRLNYLKTNAGSLFRVGTEYYNNVYYEMEKLLKP